jgi:hypothetical protein
MVLKREVFDMKSYSCKYFSVTWNINEVIFNYTNLYILDEYL